MYKAALTASGGSGFRPWNARLGRLRGLGVYTPGEYVVPTWSDGIFQRQNYPFVEQKYSFRPGVSSVPGLTLPTSVAASAAASSSAAIAAPQVGVTGLGRMYRSSGLGLDLSQLTSSPVFWLAAAAAGYYFFLRKR